jgi:hypothetical protein
MDRLWTDPDTPLIRERGYHPEQLTEAERREFAERLREDQEMRASSRWRDDGDGPTVRVYG